MLTVVDPLTLAELAEIVAEPALRALTTPEPLILALV
jgi:hypothetical protein